MRPYDGPVTPDELEGALLDGRYLVGTTIASGGMSTVYRGLDRRLDRPVAIKVMDARYAGDQQFLNRFRLEARAAARLSHPSLVAVYDQGVDLRRPFLVLELVEGGTLRELLVERGPMPPHAAAAVLRPVLAGLSVAHDAGLIHRDVKPENVLISDTGEVKLADFGLVRAVAEAGITSSSLILGTPAYLSPEQVQTGDADPRSDIYALGIVAFELLTGRTPFTGDTPLSVAYQRIDSEVPLPSSAIDGVPAQFDTLVARATRRDPDRRYPSTAEMSADLEAIVAELGLPPFRVPAPQNSAEHSSASTTSRRPPRPPHNPTRRFTRTDHDLEDGSGDTAHLPAGHPTRHTARPPDTESTALDEDGYGEFDEDSNESDYAPARFAGIAIDDFAWDRHRRRRNLLIAVLIVLVLTALSAAAGWSLGTNLPGYL